MGQQRHIVTPAFILKTTGSGEINKYFTFISPELGIKNALAYGAAKIKSRFCPVIQPFVNTNLMLYRTPRSSYLKLEDFNNPQLNDFIKQDIKSLYLGYFFSDVILNTFISQEESKSFYYLLLYSIEILKEYHDVKKAFLFFTAKFFFLSGYTFYLGNCKACKRETESYYFNFKAGGVFCDFHAPIKKFKISRHAAQFWKKLIIDKYVILKELTVDDHDFQEIYRITLFLMNSIFEKKLNTIKTLGMVF